MALSVATRGHVLETGTITLSGSAAELAADPKIKRAYLGGYAAKNVRTFESSSVRAFRRHLNNRTTETVEPSNALMMSAGTRMSS